MNESMRDQYKKVSTGKDTGRQKERLDWGDETNRHLEILTGGISNRHGSSKTH